jgi:hypothetical protein
MKLIILFVYLMNFSHVLAQDLTKQRIWKISSKKRSVFLDKGIFYSDQKSSNQQLVGVRNSFAANLGYERIVLDFSNMTPPRIYGHIAGDEKKVYLDLKDTQLLKKIDIIKNIKYLKNVDFFNIDKDNLSLELIFNEKVSFDIFYLENPGRLVIDVKK